MTGILIQKQNLDTHPPTTTHTHTTLCEYEGKNQSDATEVKENWLLELRNNEFLLF